MKIKHTLSMSYIIVYAPTKVCETEEDVFYSNLDCIRPVLPLRTMKYILVPMVLVSRTPTTLS